MSARQGASGGQRKGGRAAVCWEKAIENPQARFPYSAWWAIEKQDDILQ